MKLEGDGVVTYEMTFYLMYIFNVMNVKLLDIIEKPEIKFKDKSM